MRFSGVGEFVAFDVDLNVDHKIDVKATSEMQQDRRDGLRT